MEERKENGSEGRREGGREEAERERKCKNIAIGNEDMEKKLRKIHYVDLH